MNNFIFNINSYQTSQFNNMKKLQLNRKKLSSFLKYYLLLLFSIFTFSRFNNDNNNKEYEILNLIDYIILYKSVY